MIIMTAAAFLSFSSVYNAPNTLGLYKYKLVLKKKN